MRIIVMGTGPFAVPTIQRLLRDGHDIPLVVTRPLVDAKAKKAPSRPVFEWASAAGIPVFEPASINAAAAVAELQQWSADLFFVCDYGQILSNECLATAKFGGVNLHGSLLPRHRGAAPVQWALLRGDEIAGVTVIHMTPRLDAGPALAISNTRILPDETAGELELRLAQLGVDTTLDAIAQLEDWDGTSSIGVLQDRKLVTKAPRFAKSDGQLDFRLSAGYLVRLVRACQPWPGTFAELLYPHGKQIRVLIRAARCHTGVLLKPLAPGCTASMSAAELGLDWPAPWKELMVVGTSQDSLLVGRLQPAGKREMIAEEFLRGHPLESGCQFILPDEPKMPLA